MNKPALSRRNFIRGAAITYGSILLLPGCTFLSAKSSWRFFTEEEGALVDAIAEQIIPTDEWTGAKYAGVTNFIDKQLVGPYTRYQEEYRNGLAAIRTSCNKMYHKLFEQLTWDEQTAFLKKMEAGGLSCLANHENCGVSGEVIWQEGTDCSFFSLIRNHTMQGYYGSPRHGGNKDYISYKMVGLGFPFIVGQNRYPGGKNEK